MGGQNVEPGGMKPKPQLVPRVEAPPLWVRPEKARKRINGAISDLERLLLRAKIYRGVCAKI